MSLEENEILIRKSRANHRANQLDPFDWTGGRLLLTDHRLVFRPHSLNFRTEEESIPLENIVSIEMKHNDFISSKMTILLRNGCVEEFRVPKRKNWVKDIQNAAKKKSRGKDWDNNKRFEHPIPKKSFGWRLKVTIQALLLVISVSALVFILLIIFSK